MVDLSNHSNVNVNLYARHEPALDGKGALSEASENTPCGGNATFREFPDVNSNAGSCSHIAEIFGSYESTYCQLASVCFQIAAILTSAIRGSR
ncbi:hypothetical protein GGR95_002836 [Sulfitobacter undariae]|uniref:Uncharacterized protein n=1 Tax=Sulfitobacter undariae TaxID=1563671 RepID=A0A7W6E5M1_9RHOB|nr:hypothetical protein [Sulfitobacter undariae]